MEHPLVLQSIHLNIFTCVGSFQGTFRYQDRVGPRLAAPNTMQIQQQALFMSSCCAKSACSEVRPMWHCRSQSLIVGPETQVQRIHCTWRGSRQLSREPWPSLPQRPSPQVKSAPILDSAALWYGPQDTCTISSFVSLGNRSVAHSQTVHAQDKSEGHDICDLSAVAREQREETWVMVWSSRVPSMRRGMNWRRALL